MERLFIGLTVAAVLLIPMVCALLWLRLFKDSKPLLMGALCFFTFAAVAESIFHMLCLDVISPVKDFLNSHIYLLISYSCFAAGLFEELGRRTVYRLGLENYRGRAVAAGFAVGHFGAEIVILTVLPLIFGPPGNFTAAMATRYVWERLVAGAGHTALSLIVWKSVNENRPLLTPFAIFLHAACDFPLGMLRYGLISPMKAEIGFSLCVTVLCIVACFYWRSMPKGVIITEGDIGKH